MLKKNIFKIFCLILVLFAGISFLIPKNQKQDIVLADIADITANDFMAYLDDFKDWSSSVEGTIGNYYCLRDDYVLYTQDQNPYGLCWSYSANMALTTSIMMKTGEYYDFSENWISTTFDYLCNSGEYNDLKNKLKLMIKNFNTYNIGGGGLFFLNDYISRMAGVVLESDFNYTDFQVLCSENAGLAYEMYSQYANEYIMNNLISGYFNVYTDDEYSSQSSVIMSSIRSHIKNYGAVSANMYWNSTYATNCTSTNNINEKTITYKTPNTYKASNNSAHAITLIGWDNNIELTDTQGITHTGAWIALNSWGDNWGDDGVFYIAYDDSDFYGFYGYKYQSKASDTGTSGLHLSTNIKESNASYSTSLKGKYYDDLEPEDPQLTLQRNIFYIDNIPVTNGEKIYKISYGYTPTNNTEISNIKLFRYQQDITYSKKYKTSVLFSDNAINIVASNLDAGVYKVLIEYTDGTNYEEFLTCFYVMNGSEINKAEHYFGDTVSTNYSTTNPSGIYNNGVYNLHNDYNYEDGSLVFYSKSLSEKLTIDFQLSVYSSVASVEKESNNSYATIRKSAKGDVYEYVINYDLNEKNNYPLTLTSTGGTTKTLNIYIYLANASDNMINVMYDTAGGANNELNLKRTIVSSGSSAKIYQPIASDCEEGKYIFNGWYTDSELTKPLQKIDNEGSAYWLLPYSSVSIISNPTLDSSCKTNFATCLYNASFVYLYADWSYQPPIYNITFVYNNGDEDQTFEYEKYSTIIEPTIEREGYNLIGWYTTDTFEDNSIWSFNAHVTEDITLYAKWEIKKFNVNIFYYDTETANEVYSTENGTGIAYNSTLTLPNVLKKGYTLLGFYTEDNNLWDFNTGITYDLNLYAKWSLNEMQSVSIEPSVLATETFTKFTVSASFIHEKNFATSSALSIQWYKNGEEYQTTSTITSESEGNSYIHTITITNKVEIEGNYTYYAIISIQEDQYFTSETTERVTIAISKKEVGISNIDYSNKKEISWKDDEAGSGYVVNLFKKVNESFELVYSTNNPSESKDNIDVWTNGIKSKNGGKGVYYIQIQKYIGEDNIGSVETNEFSIFEVKYNTTMPLDNNYLPSLVDDGDIVSEPTVPTAPYYTFAGWYTSKTFEDGTLWSFNNEINSDVQLYAKWTIVDDIRFAPVEDINENYNNLNLHSLYCTPNHNIQNATYNYRWYKVGTDQVISSNSQITVKYVKDSGTYYCNVTLTDQYGFTKQTTSPEININIAKAETAINTANIKKVYTYNGKEQIISSGAYIDRTDEADNTKLEYSNNKFTDVPEEGKLLIKVFAPATDNYKEQTAYAEIEIYKAKSSVTAESYQAYTYCASVIVPKYKLGSSLSEAQQEVIIQCENEAQLLNAGTYKNVTIIAKESKNFEQSSAVVTVEINRARVNLIFKDKTSVWLFDLEELEYEITGEFYGQEIKVEIACGVNKNKVGNYTITGQIVDSANYVASIYDATYTVTAGPYYFIAIIIIAFVIILLVLLHNRKFVIEFRENGGSVIPLIETKKKKELLIKQPTKNGYRFAGWYIDSKLMIPFNGKVKRGKQLILYAKWDITKEEEIAQHTNYIVSDIMQKINPPTQQTNISNYEEYSNNLNEEIAEPKVKTEKEILNDIIQKANNNSKPANDDEMNNILTSLNMQYIIQQKQVKKEEKPKTQEEIMQELISKAAENAGNNFEQKSIDDIINNL